MPNSISEIKKEAFKLGMVSGNAKIDTGRKQLLQNIFESYKIDI